MVKKVFFFTSPEFYKCCVGEVFVGRLKERSAKDLLETLHPRREKGEIVSFFILLGFYKCQSGDFEDMQN